MPISGNAVTDVAPRARSGASLIRVLVRVIALLGGTIAALVIAASTASADDGSLTSGLDKGLGTGLGTGLDKVVTKVVTPKVAPVHLSKPVSDAAAPVVAQARNNVETAEKAVATTLQTPAAKSVQQVTQTVAKAAAPVTHTVENLQPSKGIPTVDKVVREATAVVEHVAPAPVTQPLVQAIPSTVLPPAAVVLPTSQVRSVEPTPAPVTGHHLATSFDAGSPVVAGVLVPAAAHHTVAATSARHQVGSAFQGLSTGFPTDLPQLPAAPAQGPVVQMAPGQSAGELAVLDAVLRDGPNGLTRLRAGDEGAQLRRALAVDTRPA